MRRRFATGIIGLSVLVAACDDDPVSPSLPSSLGVAGDGSLPAVLESLRSSARLPALGAALYVGDQLVESAAVGVRAQGFPEPVTPADQWHLGSISKAMTATLAARLVEAGSVGWATTVGEVFPDLVGSIRSEYEDVRLDELLYHTSGLSNELTFASLQAGSGSLTERRRAWTAELLAHEPATSRGTHLYSNAGYIVAGSMLEETTGESWEALMRREVFDVLGMTSSGFGPPGQAGSRTQPWAHVPQDGSWAGLDPGNPAADNPPAIGPAGTVHSTFTDFGAYVNAHLAGARGQDGILTASTFEKLHTPATGTSYGLGWGVGTRPWANGEVLQHSGSNGLWFAVLWLAPERDLGMLAVTNAGGDVAAETTDLAIQALISRLDAASP